MGLRLLCDIFMHFCGQYKVNHVCPTLAMTLYIHTTTYIHSSNYFSPYDFKNLQQ